MSNHTRSPIRSSSLSPIPSATKKPTSRGRRWVDIHFGPRRLPIEVHEDLLCAHSPYFKALLQAVRKPIAAGTDCVVCEMLLHAAEDNVTHCKACGQNVHNECIDRWLEKSALCPLCRAVWAREDRHCKVSVAGLDRKGFASWVNCVYGSALPLLRDEHPDAEVFDAHIIGLMRAFSAAKTIQDMAFQDAIIAQIAADIEAHDRLPGLGVVRYLFSEMERDADFKTIRAFIIDIYALKWVAGEDMFWMGHYDLHGVAEFMSSLLTAQSKAKESQLTGKAKPTMDDIVRMHMLGKVENASMDEGAVGDVFEDGMPEGNENGDEDGDGEEIALMKIPGYDILIPETRVV